MSKEIGGRNSKSDEQDLSEQTLTQLRYNFITSIEAIKLEIDYLQDVFNEISRRAGEIRKK